MHSTSKEFMSFIKAHDTYSLHATSTEGDKWPSKDNLPHGPKPVWVHCDDVDAVLEAKVKEVQGRVSVCRDKQCSKNNG